MAPARLPNACRKGQATELGRLMRKAETVLQTAVEIEWAVDDGGLKLLQARPLRVAPAHVPDEIWLKHPGLYGHPAGIGWLWAGGRGQLRMRARARCAGRHSGDARCRPCAQSCSLASRGCRRRARRLDIALGFTCPRTRHPDVLGVNEATQRIPDGARVAVDGIAGIVRWIT